MDAADIEAAVRRAFAILEQEQQTPLELEDGVVEAIALGCGGDVRKSINAVEMCVLSAPVQDGRRCIGMDAVEQVSQRSAMRYDRDGDAHYDIPVSYTHLDVYKRQPLLHNSSQRFSRVLHGKIFPQILGGQCCIGELRYTVHIQIRQNR